MLVNLVKLAVILGLTSGQGLGFLTDDQVPNTGQLGNRTKQDCRDAFADIMFVLDSSGSVGTSNFEIMKSFTKNVINNLNIGPGKTHVGVMTFNTNPDIKIRLTDYTDKTSLKNAIQSIQYFPGNTETDKALELLRTEGFRGGRSGAPSIAIVITDGRSWEPNKTATAAQLTKAAGVSMFAIGVGSDIRLPELDVIASSPSSKFRFFVNDFNALKTIEEIVASRTCNVTGTGVVQPTGTPATGNTTFGPSIVDCTAGIAEVMFVMDSSGSVKVLNFETMKVFVKSVIQKLDIGSDKTRVGVMTFNNAPALRVRLGQDNNKAQLLNDVDRIQYFEGSTETEKALRYLRTNAYANGRTGVPKIAIVITDGNSFRKNLTKQEADAAKAAGITIFAIGVGQKRDLAELTYISSDPDERYVYYVNDFSALGAITQELAKKTCNESAPFLVPPKKPTTTMVSTTTKQPCESNIADVLFVLDSSGSVGADNFEKMKLFVKSIVSYFDIGDSLTRIGVLVFNDIPRMIFYLNDYNTTAEIMQAIDGIVYSQGGTDTAKALQLMRTNGFTNERPSVPNVAVVITDGMSKSPDATRLQATYVKQNGITTFAIGVGNYTNVDELKIIASTPKIPGEKFVYEVSSFDALKTLEKVVAHATCGIPGNHSFVIINATTASPTQPHRPGCYDQVDNCDTYGIDMCTDYQPWARAHCQRTCGFCPAGPTTPVPCKDSIPDCHQYGTYICTDVTLFKWTNEHCRAYCGICGNGTVRPIATTTTAQPTPPACVDKIPKCHEYGGMAMCTNPKYDAWARNNCAKYCGFCGFQPVTSAPIIGSYQCPTWSLPSVCSLVSYDKSCCPLPSCPPGYTLTVERRTP